MFAGLTFDHVVPKSLMRLRSKPSKSTWLLSVTVKMTSPNIPAEWAPYWTNSLDR